MLKTAVRETYPGRRISPSYQLRSIFGLLKAGYTSYFHACLKVPNSSRLQIVEPLTVIRSIGIQRSRWSSKLPPLRPPGLDSLIANRVVEEEKFFDRLVDAQGIGQGLEEMASRASPKSIITCCKLSKSLLNPEKVQGSTMQTPIKSGDFPSLPVMLHSFHRSQPGSIHFQTQLPRDAPHRSTHQTLTPSSPIWLRIEVKALRWFC